MRRRIPRLPAILALGSLALAATVLAAITLAAPAAAEPPPDKPAPGRYRRIHVVDFEGVIEPVLAAYVKRAVERAKEDHADLIVLRIDSPGGRVDSSQATGDLLVGLPDSLPVIAWVPEQAYSGAAMVALACDEIVMTEAAHLGDAQPILIDPDGGGIKPVGEKFESPLRAKFREYAEKNGYPALLAEAMVSASMEVLRVRAPDGTIHLVRGKEFREAADGAEIVAGVKKSDLVQVGPPVDAEGQLLTMTAKEARDLGFLRRTFAEGRAFPKDEAEVLAALRAPDAVVVQVDMSFSERSARFLADLVPMLGAVVALALMLLLFQGPGLFTILGGIALALIGLITFTAELEFGLPIFLLVLGGVLLAVEILLIPGFGIPGFLGIASLFFGFLSLTAGISVEGTGSLSWDLVVDFGAQFVVTLLVGIAIVAVFWKTVPGLVFGKRLTLAPPEPLPAGGVPLAADLPRTGEIGTTTSPLRPAGSADFDGRIADVVSESGFVERGVRVRVLSVEGPTVLVRAEPRDEPGSKERESRS